MPPTTRGRRQGQCQDATPGDTEASFIFLENAELNLGMNDFSALNPEFGILNRGKLNRIALGIAFAPAQFDGAAGRRILGFVVVNLINVFHQFGNVTTTDKSEFALPLFCHNKLGSRYAIPSRFSRFFAKKSDWAFCWVQVER
jgi:hypothetical protein